MNREYLKSLHIEGKKAQASHLIGYIMNNVKAVASTGKTSYYHDITRSTFGPPVNEPGIFRGSLMEACSLPLSEFLVFLKEALSDCSVTLEITDENGNLTVDNGVDASGNIIDASGNIMDNSGNLVAFLAETQTKKNIHISWD